MLVDHIGYIIFPDVLIFRLIGRIAMPIFAFFIGEGCLYTKNRKKYFLRVFILGLICQAVYVAESFITKSGSGLYLNILLTFSLSIVLCSSFLYFKENRQSDSGIKFRSTTAFILCVIAVLLIEIFCENSIDITGINIEFDYGIFGISLPLFAALSKNKRTKLIAFSAAQIAFGFSFYGTGGLYLCSLIPLGLLLFYNGKAGKINLKYFFYAFYPCHLALIYLINMFI